ncbi:SHOCT domain-containing protein [Nonomuraea candida]|uniref:SHOCT domain-containing protein n=1 Tax=Nonomuraea candida TaxID=359159 RepID=UPI001B802ADA|nr:SHOCT domain-containing protein [Nonomuraea candida]
MNALIMPGPHWGAAGGIAPVFPIIWAALWIGFLALAVVGWRKGWWGPRRAQAATAPAASPAASPTASAEQILAERYARGEMTDEEYFERMSVLRGASS